MTAVQKARLAGFNASLAQRGVVLSLSGSEVTLDALVEQIAPEAGEYSISEETRDASKLHILRSAEGVGQVEIGSVLADAAGSSVHRVTRIEDHPANIAVVFHCETSSRE